MVTEKELQRRQVPAIYRRRIGAFFITIISDGYLEADPAMFSSGAERFREFTDAAFLKPGPFRLGTVAYLVESGTRKYLVDAGCGPLFGQGSGFLVEHLRSVGTSPEEIEAVLVTHMHADHIGGLLDDAGAVFPNAEIVMHAAELGYYMGDAVLERATDRNRPWVLRARTIPEHYANVRTFDKEGEILPGVSAFPLPGHTPGHSGFVFESQGELLFLAADLVYSPIYSFRYPEENFTFDVDREAALQSRLKGLDMLATERWLMSASHLPFPALGHVCRHHNAYDYVAEEWRFEP